MDKKVKTAVNELITDLCETAKRQNSESHDGLPATVEAIARLLESSQNCVPVSDAIGFVVPTGGGEDE
ncbi:hypothetical protein [Paenibacillus xylanexedens]|uniref:hypothetical protein n=1 Tax=Paenibacillus xylanexedens TaxID=528191 RepID=UPI0011A33A4F|nr:hypothetical protein [Paenibacillus xylanexedens]